MLTQLSEFFPLNGLGISPFLKSWRQKRHFVILLTLFHKSSKCDLFFEFLASGDLWWPRHPNLPTFNELRKIDPKCSEIYNLTSNPFFRRNYFQISLIILSHCFLKLVESFIQKKNKRNLNRQNGLLENLYDFCGSILPLKDGLSDMPTFRCLKNFLRK